MSVENIEFSEAQASCIAWGALTVEFETKDEDFPFLPLHEKIQWLAYSWFFYDRDIDPMINDICNQIGGGC